MITRQKRAVWLRLYLVYLHKTPGDRFSSLRNKKHRISAESNRFAGYAVLWYHIMLDCRNEVRILLNILRTPPRNRFL